MKWFLINFHRIRIETDPIENLVLKTTIAKENKKPNSSNWMSKATQANLVWIGPFISLLKIICAWVLDSYFVYAELVLFSHFISSRDYLHINNSISFLSKTRKISIVWLVLACLVTYGIGIRSIRILDFLILMHMCIKQSVFHVKICIVE